MDRFQNYFINNDKKYYTGTCVVIKHGGDKCDASFLCVNKAGKEPTYVFKLKGPKYYYRLHLNIEDLRKRLITVYTDVKDPYVRCPTTCHLKDSQIDGLSLAWAWYIFLMVITTVFKGQIIAWIFYSIVFFRYRSRKINASVCVDWHDDGSANREYNEKINGTAYYKPYFDWKAAQEAELRKSVEQYMKRGF